MDGTTWWERDEVNVVASYMDPSTLANFAQTCEVVRALLRSRETIRWLAEVRGLDPGTISSVEQLELAETMATLSSSIFFGMGSFEVGDDARPHLRRCAQMLHRHRSISLYIEAHCGLEAIFHLPAPGQARMYTEERAAAVRDALFEEAATAKVALDPARIVTRAWGCSRPLAWAFSDGHPTQYCDSRAAAKNRRVELYLRSGGFEVPRRRKRSEIPVSPNSAPLEDTEEEDVPTADGTEAAGGMVPSFMTDAMVPVGMWQAQRCSVAGREV